MSAVLTLIANPAAPLEQGDLDRAATALGAPAGAPDWLAPGIAVDIPTTAPAGPVIEEVVRTALMGRPIDVALLPLEGRRKRLLIADMDSTMIGQECIDELADLVGKRKVVSAITERAMRGELDFEAALKERVGLLAGLDAKVLDEVAERITLMPGAQTLIRTLKADGCYCALVSGGFTVFTERIAARLGFDEHQANVLEVAGGKLTGRVLEPILGREAKLHALQRLTTKLGLPPPLTLAVGDGANDLAMLEAAGLGVAFRAKPMVREAASQLQNGATITHGDLTGLLYLQGYQKTELPA